MRSLARVCRGPWGPQPRDGQHSPRGRPGPVGTAAGRRALAGGRAAARGLPQLQRQGCCSRFIGEETGMGGRTSLSLEP